MASECDWEGGEGLLGMDDPAEWDAACERGENHLGTAAIGLAYNCSLEEAAPRIVRAMQFSDSEQRRYAFTAAGAAARVNRNLTPQLYAALRDEGPKGLAMHAIADTLYAVPFRNLPLSFKWRKVRSKARNKLESWWLRSGEAVGDAWRSLRGRRS